MGTTYMGIGSSYAEQRKLGWMTVFREELKAAYQNANTSITGFENTYYPDNF